MTLFVFGISLLGMMAGVVLLILGLIKKKKLKGGIVLGVSVLLFFVSLIMPAPEGRKEKVEVASKSQEELNKEKEAEQAKIEEETKVLEDEKKAKEEEKKAKIEEERKAKEAEEKALAEQKATAEKEITVNEAKEIFEDWLGENDKLISLTIEDGEIKAVINLGPNRFNIPLENMAVTSYSSVSDTLLEEEGWNALTIEYVNVGTVSMDISEKESNEFGMYYFPVAIITERLK